MSGKKYVKCKCFHRTQKVIASTIVILGRMIHPGFILQEVEFGLMIEVFGHMFPSLLTHFGFSTDAESCDHPRMPTSQFVHVLLDFSGMVFWFDYRNFDDTSAKNSLKFLHWKNQLTLNVLVRKIYQYFSKPEIVKRFWVQKRPHLNLKFEIAFQNVHQPFQNRTRK